MSGAKHRETKTSPRRAPARPCAPNSPRSCEHRPRASPGPSGSPPTRRRILGPGPPPSRFPSQFGNRAPGDKGGGRAGGSGSRRPFGLGGKPSVASSPSPLPPPHSPPAHLPLSGLPTSSPTHPLGPRPWPAASQPALWPPLTCRRGPPEPPPPPGLGPSRRPPPHVPRVAIAFAATVISPPPPPPPPPSLQSPAAAKAAPAAQSHREAPAHCAPRWGRGGGVPPRSGSRGYAARGAVVGGGVRSAGAEARASNFPRWGPRAPGRGSGAALVGTTQARGVWALGGRSLRLPDSSFLQLDPQDRNSAVGSASLRAGN